MNKCHFPNSFLTGSQVATGNWGLLDQVAALRWVKKNIASFGGDPRQISIAADRSGADITSIHLLAKSVDSNLFERAVLMVSPILLYFISQVPIKDILMKG